MKLTNSLCLTSETQEEDKRKKYFITYSASLLVFTQLYSETENFCNVKMVDLIFR